MDNTKMKWKWISALNFSEVESIWQNMQQGCGNYLLLDKKFVRHLILQFCKGKELIGICYQKDQPVAIGIFIKTSCGTFETFQPSQAPVGLWMVSPDIAVNMILAGLVKQFPGFNVLVSILHQDPNISLRLESVSNIKTIDYIRTSFVHIMGLFDDYWRKRSKNLKHNLKRQRNRLQKEGVTIRFKMITHPNEMMDAVKEYGELETKGWKGKEGTNINISNSQGQFYANMLKSFAEDQKAIVFKYLYDDLTVAMDLCIMDDTTLIILKTTYDENQKTSSPAFLMLEEIVQYIFSLEKIQRIEFFGKVMDWHTKWIDAADIRTMYHINYYRFDFIKSAHNILFRLKSIKQTKEE